MYNYILGEPIYKTLYFIAFLNNLDNKILIKQRSE